MESADLTSITESRNREEPSGNELRTFTSDLSTSPTFGLYDVFSYLLHSRADYDRKKPMPTKVLLITAYSSMAHVEKLEYCGNWENVHGIFGAEVNAFFTLPFSLHGHCKPNVCVHI